MNFTFVAVCILKKKKFFYKKTFKKIFGDYWEFPGGKLEKNETFEEAIKRELFEELGVRIKIQDLINLDLVNHTYDKKKFYYDECFLYRKMAWKNKKQGYKRFFLG